MHVSRHPEFPLLLPMCIWGFIGVWFIIMENCKQLKCLSIREWHIPALKYNPVVTQSKAGLYSNMGESPNMLIDKSESQEGTHSMMYDTTYFLKSLRRHCLIFPLGKQIQIKVLKEAT